MIRIVGYLLVAVLLLLVILKLAEPILTYKIPGGGLLSWLKKIGVGLWKIA